jgi:hypothetical protein
MPGDSQQPPTRARAIAVLLASAAAMLTSRDTALGQIIAIGPPSFQTASGTSLQEQILDRIASTGQYQPGDLANLARITVLQSIAMFSDLSNDLTGSPAGVRLEAEASALWQAGVSFDEVLRPSRPEPSVASRGSLYPAPETAYLEVESTLAGASVDDIIDPSAPDLTSPARTQFLYDELQTAYRQLESTLGEFPGLSNRAASRLDDIGRMMGTMSVMMSTSAESAIQPRAKRSLDLDALAIQLRMLANAIVNLNASTQEPALKRAVPTELRAQLDEVLALIEDLNGTLPLGPTTAEIVPAFHTIARRMARSEATIVRPDSPPQLQRPWRSVRTRMNVISDELGLPRVIDLAPPARPVARRAAPPRDRPGPVIYRGDPPINEQ